ncbi:C-Maf-inducing protein [Temnothorax longispinosus]|uniref:C-Maf-inducing protein n=1 Tax=Temnothorax longispinosus TaxID=300112 RepID=A0A4S2KMN0_9HYME|nr:C-Maf-inducing protein [Temnothorax longispinosus]
MFLPNHSGRIPSQYGWLVVASLSTGKSKFLLTNVILSLTRRMSNASERNRHGSEVTSVPTLPSGTLTRRPGSPAVTARTLPIILILNPRPERTLISPSEIMVVLNSNKSIINERQDENYQIPRSLPSPTRNPYPGSRNPCSDEGQQGSNTSATTISSPSPEKENDDKEEQAGPEFETENSSLPCSPAAASIVGLDFFYGALLRLHVCEWRRDAAGDHQHQLAPAIVRCEFAFQRGLPADICSFYGEDSSPSMDSLKSKGSGRDRVPRDLVRIWNDSAGCSSASSLLSPRSRSGPAGPCFKLFEDGDVQVCYLNQIRTFLKKTLCSKFLRRWETHHLYLNDCCLFSKTLSGFLQQPVPIVLPDGSLLLQDAYTREQRSCSKFFRRWETHHLYLNDCCLSSKTLTSFLQQHVSYSSMSEIWKYVVARWDPAYKNCFSIVLPDGSLLLQDSNAYTRDQKISFEKGDIQVCCLNQTQIIVKKILSSKCFRRWETHLLYLNDCCLSSKTLTGFFSNLFRTVACRRSGSTLSPATCSVQQEIRKYVVARWDPAYKNCLSIVLPDRLFLLQDTYTTDQ